MRWYIAFAPVLISSLVGAAGAPVLAQTNAPALHYLPGGTDVLPRAPGLFTRLRGDLFTAVDPLDNRLVIFDQAGHIRGSSAPLPFVPSEVRETPSSLDFIDSGQRIIVPRSIDPTTIGTFAAEPPAPQAAGGRRSTRSGAAIILPFSQSQNLIVRPLAGGHLTNATSLGTDDQNRAYVQSTELMRSQPAIEVRSFVQRFSPQGRLIDVAAIPIAAMDSVPDRVVALDPAGRVTALVPTADRLDLQVLTFRPLLHGQVGPAPAAPQQRTTIDATVEQSSRDAFDAAPVAAAPLPRISRAAIIANAQTYLNVNWTMQAANFSRVGVDSVCSKTEGKYWERPHRFTAASIGKSFTAMPYHWGGDDTPDSFRTKLADGQLAGSVCTCREERYKQCVVLFATGVDCSGFVSRAWGIPKRGTVALGKVGKPLGDVTQLKPGDALLRAGHHVRLFVGFRPGADTVANVLESATNLRCEGVCSSSYTLEQLNGYKPLRFSGVTN